MFERSNQPLLTRTRFIQRLAYSMMVAFICITIALYIGMLGYHYFERMGWVDAFVNAAMILSGMGPVQSLATVGGKLFAGFYALFSGLTFIFFISIIFAPLVHRFLHKFHVEEARTKN